MRTEIYYFSGTGNSLVVVRDIAEKLGGKLVSIPAVMVVRAMSAEGWLHPNALTPL